MEDENQPVTRVFLNKAEEIAYDRAQAEKAKESHGQILPIKENEDGWGLGLPQWMMDVKDAITLPRDTIQGYQPTEKDVANFAVNVAGGGLTASSIAKPDADLGMFLGSNAASADLNKLAEAMIMKQKGSNRDEIWNSTGWWQKPDGGWAWELSDDDMYIDTVPLRSLWAAGGGKIVTPAEDLIDHPVLFSQYLKEKPVGPASVGTDFKQTPFDPSDPHGDGRLVDTVGLQHKEGYDPSGAAYTGQGHLEINNVKNEEQARKLLLHELQHFVQSKEPYDPINYPEGWKGMGSNPDVAASFHSNLKNLQPEGWDRYSTVKDKLAKQTKELYKVNSDIIESEKFIDNMTGNTKWYNFSGKQELEDYKSVLTDAYSLKSEIEDRIGILKGDLKNLSNNQIKGYEKAGEEFERWFGSTPFDTYRRDEGEALANLTALRADMTDEERKLVPPWLMYGAPDPLYKDLSIPFEEDIHSGKSNIDNFMDNVKSTAYKNKIKDTIGLRENSPLYPNNFDGDKGKWLVRMRDEFGENFSLTELGIYWDSIKKGTTSGK